MSTCDFKERVFQSTRSMMVLIKLAEECPRTKERRAASEPPI